MNDSRLTQLEQQLAQALSRISQLEKKVETMRGNINTNFSGHATALARITDQIGIRDRFTFQTSIDVARGH